jgi:DNA invertase Pin-like site-specific DNA recombinase
MARHTLKLREEARQVYLTAEVTSVAEIARRLRVKPHTVGRWKKEEDWDALRLKIDKRAAEQLVERLATERVNLNAQHFKLWNAVVSRLFAVLSKDGLKGEDIRTLEKAAAILERAQKGQRLARGLSLDGQTEEQIRAESEAEVRALIDLFIDVIKTEVADEELRDRISRAILARVPVDADLEVEPA